MPEVPLLLFSEIPDLHLDPKDHRAKWLKEVLAREKKEIGEINIIFVTDGELLKLNKEFLNRDYLTDVISFDYSSDQETSGDIYISLERVRDNSLIYKTSEEKELLRVMVHGVLHLAGYKDATPDEKEIMKSKEDYYLDLFQKS